MHGSYGVEWIFKCYMARSQRSTNIFTSQQDALLDSNRLSHSSVVVAVLRGRKLGHGLGSLGYSVLRQFSRKHQSDRSLNFSARKCCLLVVRRKFAGFCCDALKEWNRLE